MKAPMKFELLAGSHSNDQGHHSMGDIVDAYTDLTVAFPNKFKRRHDLEVSAAAQRRPAPVVATKKPAPAPEPAAEEEDEGELTPNPSGDAAPQTQDEEAPDASAGDTEKKPAQTGAKAGSKSAQFGDDVTADFPKAKDADFRVYKNGAGFWVVDPDEADKALNAKALKKGAVAEFIGGFLK